jgi:hypothetical protein
MGRYSALARFYLPQTLRNVVTERFCIGFRSERYCQLCFGRRPAPAGQLLPYWVCGSELNAFLREVVERGVVFLGYRRDNAVD